MDGLIRLLSKVEDKDQYGVDRVTYMARDAFCNIKNVSMTEFFDAGRNGIKPEYQMTVFHADYNGEVMVEYEGFIFAVYRTYRSGDYTELYMERKGGANGITIINPPDPPSPADVYPGPYEAIPKWIDQTMMTESKNMLKDFKVREIPLERVSNPSGGYTAIIGG